MKPFFSIIVVCKNSAKTIERTFKSLRNQTFRNFELIVLDGLSTDKTLSIIKKNRDIINIFQSEKDKNIWDAINKGIKISSGKIIGVLNSDDVLYPRGLDIVYKYFQLKRLDYLMASVKKKRIYHGFHPKKIWYKFNIYPSHSVGFFLKRKIYFKLGLYDVNLKFCADYDLIFKLIKNNFKGSQTSKSEVVGKFYDGGASSRIGYLKTLFYESKVRYKNNQSIFLIFFLFLLNIANLILKKYILKNDTR